MLTKKTPLVKKNKTCFNTNWLVLRGMHFLGELVLMQDHLYTKNRMTRDKIFL